MIAANAKLLFLSFVTLLAFALPLDAQNCINKYSALEFETSTFEEFYKSSVTNNNEIISAGKLYDYNSAAHIAKYSANGNLLWSYRYNLDYYDFIKLIFFKAVNVSDMVCTADGGIVIAGNVEQVLSPFGLPPPVKQWGLLAKLDRFGKVLWTKTFTKGGKMSVTNVCATSNGDVVAYLGTDNGPKRAPGDHSYNDVLRVGPAGEIKWSTFLFTYLFDAGGLGVDHKRAMLQAQNGNIIIGDVLHKTTPYGIIREGNLHFFELDFNTGKIIWETSYEYPAPANDSAFIPDIVHVKELPNGKFAFLTSLYLPDNGGTALVKRGVNIITGNTGQLETVTSYSTADGSPCYLKEAANDHSRSTRSILLQSTNSKTLFNINDAGAIIWQKGYSVELGKFPINCFSAGRSSYNIFRSNNNSKKYSLLITDALGAIDCLHEPAAVVASPAVLNYGHDSVLTDLNYGFENVYDRYDYPLKRGAEHPLVQTVPCRQTLACCTDIIDRVNITNIPICEGSSYMLPDSAIIQDSGLYYVTFKTALGCDSVRFYNATIDKNVSLLSLGNDTCLTSSSNITLKATEGFTKYYWMNGAVPTSNTFNITTPGKYRVSVNNICGSDTAQIEVFDICDYPIDMPNAFTPNYDHLNDVFKIAPTNKNRLLSFSIYNRWGRLVFKTNNPGIGWDGTYKNEPLDRDTFIYWIVMEGISGKRITKKGYVTLLR